MLYVTEYVSFTSQIQCDGNKRNIGPVKTSGTVIYINDLLHFIFYCTLL